MFVKIFTFFDHLDYLNHRHHLAHQLNHLHHLDHPYFRPDHVTGKCNVERGILCRVKPRCRGCFFLFERLSPERKFFFTHKDALGFCIYIGLAGLQTKQAEPMRHLRTFSAVLVFALTSWRRLSSSPSSSSSSFLLHMMVFTVAPLKLWKIEVS